MHANIQKVKILGIDYGTKRVGLAMSDDGAEFAFPYNIIKSDKNLEDEICRLIDQEKVSAVVIGESRASNDVLNPVSVDTNKFIERLKQKIKTPIYLEREGFSTFEAHRYQPKKGHRDDSAAAIILQRYLDKNKNNLI